MTDFNPENYKRITTIGQIRELSEDDFVYRTRGEKNQYFTLQGALLYCIMQKNQTRKTIPQRSLIECHWTTITTYQKIGCLNLRFTKNVIASHKRDKI